MDQLSTAEATPRVLTGLTSTEGDRRLKQDGPNAIPERRPHPALVLLKKFWGPIPWMLEATILIQIALDKHAEAAIVAILLAVNAAISFMEEDRASRALLLLQRRLATQARVLRDGRWQTIPAANLVQGDAVHIRMGDLSPADVRIVSGNLLLDQSALTGESIPIEATSGAVAYASAVVKRGEATGEVVATGLKSNFGKTAELVRTAKSTSHLQKTIFSIVRVLVAIDVLLIGLLLAYAAWSNLPFQEVLPFALILLVASVPVALPATFTLATALGSAELAQNGILLTRLSAIEEAAGMDVLCADKTGTITENRLTLAATEPAAGVPEDELLRYAALACDDATQDPIDLAILAAARERGLLADPPRRLEFVPFDPAKRYSLGRYRISGGELCVVKGAPEAIADLCAPLSALAGTVEQMASSGNRILAIASGNGLQTPRLAGLVALEDPPRSDSQALIRGLQDLGVRVVMITGDNLATASAIARRTGIGTRMAAAETIDHLDGAHALDHDVYARAYPEHKIHLVQLLQEAGHVVGMTGDGVNDAAALKQADVGIAVAGATDVARAAAGVVLTSHGLVDALAAVKISRRIYQRMLTYTINKIMKTLEIALFLTVGVIVTHTFVITPLLIVLLLFTNDFVTMSIATDRVSYSREPDRWDVRRLLRIGGILAALVLLLSFAVFFTGRHLLGLNLAELQTLVFVMLVATGQGNVYLIRERGYFWRSRPSRWLIVSSIADLAAVVVMAINGILMAPVRPWLIASLLGAVAVYLALVDLLKVRVFRLLKVH